MVFLEDIIRQCFFNYNMIWIHRGRVTHFCNNKLGHQPLSEPLLAYYNFLDSWLQFSVIKSQQSFLKRKSNLKMSSAKCRPFSVEFDVFKYLNVITVTSYWAQWRLKPPSSRLFTQALVQAQIKVNIEAPRHWPLWGDFTGQYRGNCFHLMTSSCAKSNECQYHHFVWARLLSRDISKAQWLIPFYSWPALCNGMWSNWMWASGFESTKSKAKFIRDMGWKLEF